MLLSEKLVFVNHALEIHESVYTNGNRYDLILRYPQDRPQLVDQAETKDQLMQLYRLSQPFSTIEDCLAAIGYKNYVVTVKGQQQSRFETVAEANVEAKILKAKGVKNIEVLYETPIKM